MTRNFDEDEKRLGKRIETLQFLVAQNEKYAQDLKNMKDGELTIDKIIEIDTYIQTMMKYVSNAVKEIESERQKRI